MIDRYARSALRCYEWLRRLDPAEDRAELQRFERLLVILEHPSARDPSRRKVVGHDG